MIYCLNTNTIKSKSFIDKVEIAKQAGFNCIESDIVDICKNDFGAVRDCLEANKVEIISCFKLEGWFEVDGELMNCADNFEEILMESERRLKLAKALGAKYFIAAPPYSHRNHFAQIEKGAERFKQLCDLGKSIGIEVTIEFMGQTAQINTVDKCAKFLEMTTGRMVVDSYHLWKGSGTVDFSALDPALISIVHIADANPDIPRSIHKDVDRVLPGDGCIDFKSFFKTLRDKGYNGILSLGVYQNRLTDENPVMVAKKSLDKLIKVENETIL